MNRDTLILGVLAGLALLGLVLIVLTGRDIPDLLGYLATLLVGTLTGASLPARGRGDGV